MIGPRRKIENTNLKNPNRETVEKIHTYSLGQSKRTESYTGIVYLQNHDLA